MKKSLCFALSLLILSSCGGETSSSNGSNSYSSSESIDHSSLKILCPTGAPAVAFYNHAANDNFSTNAVPANIVHEMTSSSEYDVVVIDTTSGIKAVNAGAPYEIAATITFGNFYLASTGNDDDGKMDADDNIVLFGQGQTPDKLFHYIYGNQYDEAIEYVTNAQNAGSCLASGKNVASSKGRKEVDYVFLAEPALYASKKKNEKANVYANIQSLYKEKSNGLDLIQASIFVKNSSDKSQVNAFLSSLETDIQNAIKTPELVSEGMSKIEESEAQSKYGAASSAFVATLSDENSLGLGYKEAKGNKASIDSFINLFSMETTNEEIYYQK